MDNLEESEKECIEFIDKFITCKKNETNPFIQLQCHRHTHTCYKKKGKNKKCRFGIPLPMMRETRILHPLEEADESNRDIANKNAKLIATKMKALFDKPEEIEFDDMLDELDLSEVECIFAIRSTLKKSRVYLKRLSTEVGINAYNEDILRMFESNMDIQFILNEFAVASYIVNYISKADSNLSKLLRQAVAETDAGNTTIRERFVYA